MNTSIQKPWLDRPDRHEPNPTVSTMLLVAGLVAVVVKIRLLWSRTR